MTATVTFLVFLVLLLRIEARNRGRRPEPGRFRFRLRRTLAPLALLGVAIGCGPHGCAPEIPTAGDSSATSSSQANTPPAGVTRGFKFPDYDAERRLKSMIFGEEALAQSETVFRILHLRVETYDDAGQTNLIVQAPECFFDRQSRAAWSGGKMEAHSADGRFAIQGEGFEWNQSTGRLALSNRVDTAINEALMRPPTGERPAAARTNITIRADRMELQTKEHRAVYTGHVLARNPPDLELACEVMTLHLAGAGGGVKTIDAERSVVITLSETRAGERSSRVGRGDKAVYDAAADTIVLTGSPSLESPEGRLFATKALWHRKENRLEAEDGVRMELRAESMAGFAGQKPAAGARPAMIHADRFDFDSQKRVATYTGNVRVDNLPDMELTARTLAAHLPATGGRIERIVAERDVVLHYHEAQGAKRVTRTGKGGKAVYDAATGTLTFTGSPAVETTEGRLTGDIVSLRHGDNHLSATGRVRMELRGTEVPGKGGMPGRTAVIHADEFEFDSQKRTAFYKGNVRVTGLPEMDLACGSMTARMAPEGGKVERIDAERAVVIRYFEESGGKRTVRTGRGDRAVYEAARNTVELIGHPVLETTEGRLSADRVFLNRTEDRLSATGNVRMETQPGAMGGAVSAKDGKSRARPVTIYADEFEFASRQGVARYNGHVRVDDLPEMELLCRNMTAHVARGGGRLDRIVAEDDVSIRFHEEKNGRRELREASGRQAVYEAAGNSVTLSGDARVEVAGGLMVADPIVYDRTTQSVRPVGAYHIVIDPEIIRSRSTAKDRARE